MHSNVRYQDNNHTHFVLSLFSCYDEFPTNFCSVFVVFLSRDAIRSQFTVHTRNMCWAITLKHFLWIIITSNNETETRILFFYCILAWVLSLMVFVVFSNFSLCSELTDWKQATLIIIAWSYSWNMLHETMFALKFRNCMLFDPSQSGWHHLTENKQSVLSRE